MATIYHLDDDPFFLENLQHLTRQQGFEVRSFLFAAELFGAMNAEVPDLVILDVHLGQEERQGMPLAAAIRRQAPQVALLMCSDLHDADTVANCLAQGADDYLFKGIEEDQLVERILHVLTASSGGRSVGIQDGANQFSGATLGAVAQRIPRILDSAITAVHVFGESGTGKEVVGQLFESARRQGPFLRIHCGAIAPNLLESELFGYAKGAFTGAQKDKKGLLEQADGGWLFLDEVATLSPEAQVALLRVLENGSLRRVGCSREIQVSVRIVSATNEDLPRLVELGRFRGDLWQRLCECVIDLPPLRQRMEELPHLVERFCQQMPGGPYSVSRCAMSLLGRYDWARGNIRELRNCLRAMTENASGGHLTPASIPGYIWQYLQQQPAPRESETPVAAEAAIEGPRDSAIDLRKGLTVTWGDELPPFQQLVDQLLLKLLQRQVAEEGKCSLRSFAALTGIPKSSLSKRMHHWIATGVVQPQELKKMIGIRL